MNLEKKQGNFINCKILAILFLRLNLDFNDIEKYLKDLLPASTIGKIQKYYLEIKKLSKIKLEVDND